MDAFSADAEDAERVQETERMWTEILPELKGMCRDVHKLVRTKPEHFTESLASEIGLAECGRLDIPFVMRAVRETVANDEVHRVGAYKLIDAIAVDCAQCGLDFSALLLEARRRHPCDASAHRILDKWANLCDETAQVCVDFLDRHGGVQP